MDLILAIIEDPAVRLIIELALLVAAADVVVGILKAIKAGTFTREQVAQFLGNHVLARIIPIAALSVFAAGLTFALGHAPAGVPTDLSVLGSAMYVAAWAALAAYALETSRSLTEAAAPKP